MKIFLAHSLLHGKIALLAGIISLLVWHVRNIAGSLTDIGQNFSGMMDRLQQYLHEKLGLTETGQRELIQSPQPAGPGGIGKMVTVIMGGLILAIPFLGIAKILFDNIKPLQPLGFLIGREKRQTQASWLTKMKTKFYGGIVP